MESKICVLFPGIGYTVDRPLIYYAGKLFKKLGYEVIQLRYEGLPKKKGNDVSKMGDTFKMVMEQTRLQLSSVFDNRASDKYDSIVFVGKSIGTIAATVYAAELVEQAGVTGLERILRFVYMTPLAETFIKAVAVPSIAFHGTSDPWVQTEIVERECERMGTTLYKYKDANHSLETGDAETDIESLGDVIRKIEQFIN